MDILDRDHGDDEESQFPGFARTPYRRSASSVGSRCYSGPIPFKRTAR